MVQKDTGWTDEHVLWGMSMANLQMKLADTPCYRYGKKEAKIVDGNELERIFRERQNR
jgi:hypothetical protein